MSLLTVHVDTPSGERERERGGGRGEGGREGGERREGVMEVDRIMMFSLF